jgi:carboxypeptidase family protein
MVEWDASGAPRNYRRARLARVFARRAGTLIGFLAASLWTVIFARCPAAHAYQAIEVTNGGRIFGTVTLAGDAPALKPLEVYKNREICGIKLADESLVLGPKNGIRYAVVTIEDISRGKPVEVEESHTLDNLKCAFVPRVLAASVGHWIVLKNTDPILHTADARVGGRTLFNVALWPGRELRRPVAYPGLIHINCDAHPWMRAFVVATDHPYHAVTDAYGSYQIDDVPPGTYKVRVWHELLGYGLTGVSEQVVRVAPQASSELNFTLRAGGK